MASATVATTTATTTDPTTGEVVRERTLSVTPSTRANCCATRSSSAPASRSSAVPSALATACGRIAAPKSRARPPSSLICWRHLRAPSSASSSRSSPCSSTGPSSTARPSTTRRVSSSKRPSRAHRPHVSSTMWPPHPLPPRRRRHGGRHAGSDCGEVDHRGGQSGRAPRRLILLSTQTKPNQTKPYAFFLLLVWLCSPLALDAFFGAVPAL
ncbi:hypothetical protein TW95_gp1400 [Pandoravirus inopinatum]|uniref:Uncharacterized protein n=1 Tax=Pandoravirus inopinatum TaxID=1605721 RepID=A0A0B5J3H8_9VIRU|nr:hypothetical protein TW95_gp1400 [Pandoravirus inopinatum]AJF98134.1 hypothetical protein [Pandoravirus inopinatum]